MKKNINLKIIVIVLLAIMLISFSIGYILLSFTGGFRSFNITGDSSIINKEKTVNIKNINNIEINTISEDIIIIPTNNEEAKVCFYTNITKKNNNYEPELVINQNNTDLIINIKHKKIFQLTMFHFHAKSRLELYLPFEYTKDISVSTVSGDIYQDNYKFDNANYKTVSGDIKIDKTYAKNDVYIKTTSGDIKINGECNNFIFRTVSGDFLSSELFTNKSEIKTTSGDVKIKNFKGNLTGNLVSGDVEINYTKFDYDINIKNTSGDIELILPLDAEFKLSFNSTSGDYNSDFPITIKNINKKHNVEGIVISEKNKIEVTTISGDFDISN
jgi:lia operon protein LiaG